MVEIAERIKNLLVAERPIVVIPCIPAEEARLCIDCNAIFSQVSKDCPRCASDSWHPLTSILNRKNETSDGPE